jgi:hypothetical protein
MIPPSRWLPVLVSQDQDKALSMAEMQVLLELLMRQYNDVLDALSRGMVVMPEAHEEEHCVRFAEGFVAGAELDARWRSDEWLWRFVEPIAYLAGRFDLVTENTRIELAAKPNIKSLLCADIEPIMVPIWPRPSDPHPGARAATPLATALLPLRPSSRPG